MSFEARPLPILAVLAALLSLVGCARNIPNTDVEDTPENRAVIEFMEGYRHAVEERDVGAILAMTSPEYLDDSGTPGGDDDIDYEVLTEKLQGLREHLLDVRNYNMRYRRIRYVQGRVFVEYTYTAYFQVATQGESHGRWARRIADHRAVLERDPDTDDFKFMSGL
jgi:hypothetical protein